MLTCFQFQIFVLSMIHCLLPIYCCFSALEVIHFYLYKIALHIYIDYHFLYNYCFSTIETKQNVNNYKNKMS